MRYQWLIAGAYFVVVTAIVSFVLSRLSIPIARYLGVVDHPKERSIHEEPTPLLGGLAVFGAFTLVVWGHLLAGQFLLAKPEWLAIIPIAFHGHLSGLQGEGSRLIVVFAGGFAMFVLGLVDDIKGLSVRTRLYSQFVICFAAILLGVRPSLGFLPEALQVAVAVIWLVGITNAFNLVDGLDGLCASLAASPALVLGVAMLLGDHPAVAFFFFSLGGACVGFLILNWHPAQLFLGSAGSLTIGYLLGAMCMIATFMSKSSPGFVPLAAPILVFAVPLYDTASVIAIRWSTRRSLFEGDKSHFHYRLLRMGFSVRQAVAFCAALSVGFSLGALHIIGPASISVGVALAQMSVLILVVILMERVVGRANP